MHFDAFKHVFRKIIFVKNNFGKQVKLTRVGYLARKGVWV
jgi:hypothetical protein